MNSELKERELAKACGQLLIVGFDGPHESVPDDLASLLAKGHRSGVILFRRNVSTPRQVGLLCQSIHEAAAQGGDTPFVCIDQEGGRVVRLREPLTKIPPMRDVGLHKNVREITSLSEAVASEVSALGFNVNFAPVLDVDTNPENPVIGDRAFSSDPQRVARLGGAWALGHTMSGVIPCGKHFPGHGDTRIDSHLALPTLTHNFERLFSVELVPFRAAARTKIPMIMTAHVVVSALDPVYPATMSPALIQDLLRDKMNYDGVVVSDCLEMKAVSDHFAIEEMVERSLMAGVDLFLVCHTSALQARAFEHLLKRAKEDDAVRQRVLESAERIATLKKSSLGSWPKPWRLQDGFESELGNEEHQHLVAKFLSNKEQELVDPTEA